MHSPQPLTVLNPGEVADDGVLRDKGAGAATVADSHGARERSPGGLNGRGTYNRAVRDGISSQKVRRICGRFEANGNI